MSNSLQHLDHALQKLEDLMSSRKEDSHETNSLLSKLQEENTQLKNDLAASQKDYQILKKTSQEIINELNNSIQVIDDYFKKQDANSKNT